MVMDGVLVADKPEGWTSHDVVAAVKKRLSARKVGHLGTLDPLATGVLPLVIDRATRFARFLDGGVKEYTATLKLGEETDTYDKEGKITGGGDTSGLTPGRVISALSGFRGRIKQVPPMYSATKKNGTPLYKLARKGVVVEREAKEVEVFSLEVTEVSLPCVRFRVSCSKGTYVRSICHDAGKVLGCGAHLTGLRRTRCGDFTAGEAVSPEASIEVLRDSIIPLDEALKRASKENEALRAGSEADIQE